MHRFAGGLAALLAAVAMAGATLPGAADTASSKGEARLSAWITGYSYWDNSPPGSGAIARPVVHDKAGGTGTWADPITIAVGRAGSGWRYKPGTRIYLEGLRKYAVVEDLCGACSRNAKGRVHLDLYIGGETISARAASACARSITAVQQVLVNAAPGHEVDPGTISQACAAG